MTFWHSVQILWYRWKYRKHRNIPPAPPLASPPPEPRMLTELEMELWRETSHVIRPKHVPQDLDMAAIVEAGLFGVRNPTKKIRHTKFCITYEDGTKDSWISEKQVGVHIENQPYTSTITLTSLED